MATTKDKLTFAHATITYACGHIGEVPQRCAESSRKYVCDACSLVVFPKPSECLKLFLERNNRNVQPDKIILNRSDTWGDWLGPNLGPIGAVIYVRQNLEKFGRVKVDADGWSGTGPMHDALEGFEADRRVTPYIARFEECGL